MSIFEVVMLGATILGVLGLGWLLGEALVAVVTCLVIVAVRKCEEVLRVTRILGGKQ